MVRRQGDDIRDQVLGMFPRLRERLDQRADTCLVVNSRCWPLAVRFVSTPRCCFSMNRRKDFNPR